MRAHKLRRALGLAVIMLIFTTAGMASAAPANSELDALRREVEALRQRDLEKDQKIEALERRLDALSAQVRTEAATPAAPSPLDAALAELPAGAATTAVPAAREAPAARPGGAGIRLVDVSFDILSAAGASSAPDDILGLLEAGDHDPGARGFTLQQTELSLAGAIDPYFVGESHIVFNDDGVELEEAFATTTSLPWDLQLKAGYFLTEFGRINPTHPHAWNWGDQPIINTRLMGPEGTRGAGVRLSWLLPVDWYSSLYFGAQSSNNDSMVSFLGEGHEPYVEGLGPTYEDLGLDEVTIGNRPILEHKIAGLDDLLYLVRWENALDLSDETSAVLGLSALHGPNSSGPHGDTWIYGGDLVVKWRPVNSYNGWPFIIWESELMKRNYHADGFGTVVGEGEEETPLTYSDETLEDWGMYTQVLWGFKKDWATGLRYEYASGSGDDLLSDRSDDPMRDTRYRISPVLMYQPSHFSRLRLQYNYDHADFNDDAEHSVWLGLEVLWGAHPAHRY